MKGVCCHYPLLITAITFKVPALCLVHAIHLLCHAWKYCWNLLSESIVATAHWNIFKWFKTRQYWNISPGAELVEYSCRSVCFLTKYLLPYRNCHVRRYCHNANCTCNNDLVFLDEDSCKGWSTWRQNVCLTVLKEHFMTNNSFYIEIRLA